MIVQSIVHILRCRNSPIKYIYYQDIVIYMEALPYVSCRISTEDGNAIDALVETGRYMNRSDVMRTAIRRLIDHEQHN